MAYKTIDPKYLVHNPADIAAAFAEDYRRKLKDPGVKWGVGGVDRVVIPARAGDFVGIIGRPGDGKSTMLAALAKNHARELVRRGDAEEKCVVYVSWEQGIAEIETFFRPDNQYNATDYAWGRVPEKHMLGALKGRAGFPLWMIGTSEHRTLRRARQEDARVPKMTLEIVLDAIESMESEFNVRPDMMVFDYIQLIPVDGARGRMEQVMEAAPAIKNLAQRVRCPAFVGIQARRDVDERNWKVPQEYDAQWSSQIEQAADKLFGLWRPYRTEPPDAEPIEVPMEDEHGNINMGYASIAPELLIMQMLKQRGDRGRYTWALKMAPQWLELTAMEKQWGHSPEPPDGWQEDDFS